MKNIIVYGGLAAAGIYFFGRNKVQDIGSVINNLQVKVKAVKNLKLDFKQINFNLDIQLINPTQIPLSVSSGNVITLKQIDFFDKSGKLLAQSYPNISGIEIPSNNGIILTGVPTQILTENVGVIFDGLLNSALSAKSLQYRLHLESLGKTFTINA